MNIVDRMLKFLETRDPSLLVSDDTHDMDPLTLTSIVLDLMGWLRLEYKRSVWVEMGKKTCLKPLPLYTKYPCGRGLIRLVEEEPVFREMFQVITPEKRWLVEDAALTFRETVPEEVRAELREEAFKKHKLSKREVWSLRHD